MKNLSTQQNIDPWISHHQSLESSSQEFVVLHHFDLSSVSYWRSQRTLDSQHEDPGRIQLLPSRTNWSLHVLEQRPLFSTILPPLHPLKIRSKSQNCCASEDRFLADYFRSSMLTEIRIRILVLLRIYLWVELSLNYLSHTFQYLSIQFRVFALVGRRSRWFCTRCPSLYSWWTSYFSSQLPSNWQPHFRPLCEPPLCFRATLNDGQMPPRNRWLQNYWDSNHPRPGAMWLQLSSPEHKPTRQSYQ